MHLRAVLDVVMVIWGQFPPLILKTHAFVISGKTRNKTFIVKKRARPTPAKDLFLRLRNISEKQMIL